MPIRTAVVFMFLACLGQAPLVADTEEQLVEEAFLSYKSAIMNDQGEKAAGLLSSSTVSYYEDMRDLALYASPEELKQQSTVNLMQALLLRYRVPAEALQNMSGYDLLVHAIAQGWVGKNSVAPFSVKSVHVVDETAVADIESERKPGIAQLQFHKEGGAWRFDLVPLIKATSAQMDALAEQQGVTREELTLTLMSAASGKPVDPSIWEPPMKPAEGGSGEQ